jgi:hypothetical protein
MPPLRGSKIIKWLVCYNHYTPLGLKNPQTKQPKKPLQDQPAGRGWGGAQAVGLELVFAIKITILSNHFYLVQKSYLFGPTLALPVGEGTQFWNE